MFFYLFNIIVLKKNTLPNVWPVEKNISNFDSFFVQTIIGAVNRNGPDQTAFIRCTQTDVKNGFRHEE